MEHSSLMSGSNNSIPSTLSDIPLDDKQEKQSRNLRRSVSNELIVAAAASNCSKEINELMSKMTVSENANQLSKKQTLSSDNITNNKMITSKPLLRPTLSSQCDDFSRHSNTNEDITENSPNHNHQTYNLPDQPVRPSSSNARTEGSNTRTYIAHQYQHQNYPSKGRRKGHEADDDMSDTDISESLPFDEPSQSRSRRRNNGSFRHGQSNSRDQGEDEFCQVREIVDPMLMFGQKGSGHQQQTARRKTKTKKIVPPHRKYITGRDDFTSTDEEELDKSNNKSNFFYSHHQQSQQQQQLAMSSSYPQQQHSLKRSSRSNNSGRGRVAPSDFEDKEFLFSAIQQQKAQLFAGDQPQFTTNKPAIKTASKYFDRQIFQQTEANNISLAEQQQQQFHQQQQQHYQQQLQLCQQNVPNEQTFMTADYQQQQQQMLQYNLHQQQMQSQQYQQQLQQQQFAHQYQQQQRQQTQTVPSSPIKSPESPSPSKMAKSNFLSSFKSIFPSSSHGVAASSPSSPLATRKPFSAMRSKIGAIWKRSKSTHDKLSTVTTITTNSKTTDVVSEISKNYIPVSASNSLAASPIAERNFDSNK